MELSEAIATRRSIRRYQEAPVADEHIRTIIEAAMLAPSAGNQQPWHFVVITDRGQLGRIPDFHPYSDMVRTAPAAILICGDPAGCPWPDFWVQDCSAAAQNALLAARDLGLGTVWVGVYPIEERMAGFRQLLAIPEQVLPFALIPVGWPAGSFSAVNRSKPERVHRERW
ncbi:MAG: nitroreductase family protein [Desulfobulbus sp.]|jgi:nitroreductase|uniref:nitroreductase family protein n=1 Tax=Desulfobulbus sp. TaxID=895 RepID=UPI00284BDBEC|nr:nitroreductase family protein [Desulfobulbus sp.]MDR2550428.1 nitroreductase family protein [Desulfobulbus sp.]